MSAAALLQLYLPCFTGLWEVIKTDTRENRLDNSCLWLGIPRIQNYTRVSIEYNKATYTAKNGSRYSEVCTVLSGFSVDSVDFPPTKSKSLDILSGTGALQDARWNHLF